ncbi:metalloregulator ArsR/SmtB family transcription factor [soil metagenome]
MDLERRAKIFAALADPTRLSLVEMLANEEELCGTQIAQRAGISMALMSHHWKVLTEAGVVKRVRRGQRQFCSIDRDALTGAFELVWPHRRIRSELVPTSN